MSRSVRHNPIMGWTTAKSEKKDKQIANRRLRRCVSEAINNDKSIMPLLREISCVYLFDKDGKQRVSKNTNMKHYEVWGK
jgi:hypothetical protein